MKLYVPKVRRQDHHVRKNRNKYLITYCLELAAHGGNKNQNHFDQFYSLYLNT